MQYGSGIASSLFALKVTGDVSDMVRKIDLMDRLSRRHIATPGEYEDVSRHLLPNFLEAHANPHPIQACALRLKAYGCKDFQPSGDIASIAPGTYYLQSIDEAYRRTYAVKA